MSQLEIHTAIEINAPIQTVWAVLGEGFGDWARWAPGIESSTLEGPLAEGVIRVNRSPSLGTVRQELVRFDRAGHSLAYEMREGLPPMFDRVRNDWRLIETESGCRLEGEALFGLRPPAEAMRPQLEGKMSRVLGVFAQAVKDAVG